MQKEIKIKNGDSDSTLSLKILWNEQKINLPKLDQIQFPRSKVFFTGRSFSREQPQQHILLSQIKHDINLSKTIVGTSHNLHLWAADPRALCSTDLFQFVQARLLIIYLILFSDLWPRQVCGSVFTPEPFTPCWPFAADIIEVKWRCLFSLISALWCIDKCAANINIPMLVVGQGMALVRA